MNAVAGGLPCFLLVGLLIGLAFLAGILMAVTNAYNKFLKKRGASAHVPESIEQRPVSLATEQPSSSNPYASPADAGGANVPLTASNPIPDLSFGKALGIVVLRGVVTNITNFVLGFLYGLVLVGAGQGFDVEASGLELLREMWVNHLAITIACTLLAFLLGALIIKLLLPTSFGRACMIQLFEFLVYLFIIGVIFGVTLAVNSGVPQPV